MRQFRKILHWYRDAASAAVLLLVFGYFLYAGRDIHVMLSASGVTARFFPTLICLFGIVLCGVNMVSGLISGNAARKKALGEAGEAERDSNGNWSVAVKSVLSVGIIILYLVLIDLLGFIPASVLYLFGQMCLLTESWKRKWLLFAVISVAVSVISYVFFRNVFHLMLPKGIMPF